MDKNILGNGWRPVNSKDWKIIRRHPEEDDVVTCYQGWSWEVTFEVFWVHIRPAHGWEWPKGRTEPSIQDVFVLGPTVTFWSFFADVYFTLSIVPSRGFGDPTRADERLPSHGHFPSIGGRYRWNEVGRINLILCVLVGNGIFRQLVHLDEPLCRQAWFNHHTCTLWCQHCGHLLDFNKGHRFLPTYQRLPYVLQNGPCAANSKAKSFMVPSSFMTLTCGKLWRWPTKKSFGSWAGVIFTTPVPNSGSACSSPTIGMSLLARLEGWHFTNQVLCSVGLLGWPQLCSVPKHGLRTVVATSRAREPSSNMYGSCGRRHLRHPCG